MLQLAARCIVDKKREKADVTWMRIKYSQTTTGIKLRGQLRHPKHLVRQGKFPTVPKTSASVFFQKATEVKSRELATLLLGSILSQGTCYFSTGKRSKLLCEYANC
jgi:hypothetical protein